MYLRTVPLNYNFISMRVYTHGTTRFYACKMLKSRMETYLHETGTCNLHETWNATTRHMLLHEVWLLLLHTDSRQKSTGISYWVGNCITRGMTILYFQFTLYIAGIATGIVRSQLLRRYVQPELICQPSSLALITFFKIYILH